MYGGETPLEALLSLAVDDGDANRGHRTNIFSTDYFYTAMATEIHEKFRSETVTTFSGMFTADTNYEAPTIYVPTTAAEYTDYSTWDQG